MATLLGPCAIAHIQLGGGLPVTSSLLSVYSVAALVVSQICHHVAGLYVWGREQAQIYS